MATPQSSFIIKRLEGFGGSFVDSQHLGHAYETGKPQLLENMVTTVFSSKSSLYNPKLLVAMTGGKSRGVKEIDTEIYRWTLQGAQERTAIVVENLESANLTPGLNHSLIKIKVDVDFFHAPDVLLGADNEYPLAIVDGPIADGIGYVYTLRIQGDNPDAYAPPSMFEQGKEFSKVWTSVASEYNGVFGGQQYPNSYMLESQVSAFAQKLEVTDKAWREEDRLNIKFTYTVDGKTKMADRFLIMAEAKMWDELYRSVEAHLVYGKKQTVMGPDGYWIKTGPGLRQQQKDAWQAYYSGPLSVSDMKDFLLDIYTTRKGEGERKTVGMSGTLGAQLFHDALVAISNGYLTVDTNFINKVASPVDTPHLAYGAQYTKYNGPHGLSVEMTRNDMYDSRIYCKRMHPEYPNLPVDSARIDFLDLGDMSGDQNIQMLKVKNTFRYGYQAGTHTPSGPVQGASVSAMKAGYSMFAETTAGLWIKDITRMGAYIYDFEA